MVGMGERLPLRAINFVELFHVTNDLSQFGAKLLNLGIGQRQFGK